jgi:hypothetical protein
MYFVKHYAVKTSERMEALPLTSALDEGDWSALPIIRFTPGETAAGTHL